MNHSITFLSIFVSVVVNISAQSVRKNAEISDAKGFEQEAEGLQVLDQVIRSDTQCSSGDRRVDIVARIR